jgi:hypothetical protein
MNLILKPKNVNPQANTNGEDLCASIATSQVAKKNSITP